MSGSDAIKKYQTNMKSAQGTVILSLILNLIYIIRAVISKNLSFWFSTYVTEYMLKSSGFFPGYEGSFPKAAAIMIILIEVLLLLLPAAFSERNGKLLYICLGVYLFDTIFMAFGKALNVFGDFNEGSFIDIIFHFFVLLFIIGGILSHRKLCQIMVKTKNE